MPRVENVAPMKTADFEFDLPQELIAQQPTAVRSASRLLHLHCQPEHQSGSLRASINHHRFNQLPDLLAHEDLLVFNNTRVIPARLFGTRPTGGKVEILIERILNKQDVLAQIRASKSLKPGNQIVLEGDWQLEVTGREGSFFTLRFPEPGAYAIARQLGQVPLPPYIKRNDHSEVIGVDKNGGYSGEDVGVKASEQGGVQGGVQGGDKGDNDHYDEGNVTGFNLNDDKSRYQTVYAKRDGAVAAPTAGLHFDEPLLQTLASKGFHSAEVTLHVGAGTFQPVRVARVEDHQMHAEYVEVDELVCQAVAACKARGGRVIAVGTTSARSLETASASGSIQPMQGDTDIFIYPGYQFRTVDALITNFHLPGSSLIMLVSAMAGLDNIKAAYNEAINQSYRFYSYGDAMLITTGQIDT